MRRVGGRRRTDWFFARLFLHSNERWCECCADQMPRSDGVWWRRLQAVQCQGSFAGNQTLAALVFRSEAQDKPRALN